MKCLRESKKSEDALFSNLSCMVLQHYLAKEATKDTAHWCFMCATQSNCCSALDFLSPGPCPQKPQADRIDYKIYGVIIASWVWVVSEKYWRDQAATAWILAMHQHSEWKMQFSCFPILSGSAEAQVTWRDTVKRLLVAYYIGSISAKNTKIRSRVSKL